jgi:hypothetical protein
LELRGAGSIPASLTNFFKGYKMAKILQSHLDYLINLIGQEESKDNTRMTALQAIVESYNGFLRSKVKSFDEIRSELEEGFQSAILKSKHPHRTQLICEALLKYLDNPDLKIEINKYHNEST